MPVWGTSVDCPIAECSILTGHFFRDIPILLPSSFAELNVVTVRAVVVAGFLELFKDIFGASEPEGWCLGALRTIRLRAIPLEELAVLPDPSAQCSLDNQLNHIRREHDGIDSNKAKPDNGPTVTIALEASFGEGDALLGIKIDHTEAILEYVAVQEKGKIEKEVDGEEVEEEVDGEDPEEVEEVEGEEVEEEVEEYGSD